MNRSSELYAAGYADACNGQRMDRLCQDTPSYREGFVAGLADSQNEAHPDVLLSPVEFLSIFDRDRYALQPEPATRPKPPAAIENNERGRQAVLFTGLGCLAGQQDLFDEGGLR